LNSVDGMLDCSKGAEKIQKLTEWLAKNKFNVTEYKHLLTGLNLSPNDLQQYYSFSNDSYTRNRIVKTDGYEMLLICWEVGQMSPVHNHGSSQCFVYCIEGNVFENKYRYENSEMVFGTSKKMNAGDSNFIHDHDVYHEFGNASKTARAVSLHLYTPQIMHYNIFDKTARTVKKCDFSSQGCEWS
jgi:cysteine dioxygenase